ncbi:TetR/AcrR family transcriptional regulator [Streptomyces sp. NBC_01262]|uniref:TetR/AcrR family transcriptional regulator n=1 Tax=Streptomyces sp. NBC_01262 TaxID=2903803 RepID=UPI002E304B0E|nr:TetR family transcriptional regulator [Streptomyces sp. NBC_01262]
MEDATPPKAPKAAKSEQTRTLILETAMRLFEERGYDKTTMRAIAKEAGVSVGNAYYYFDSKEHLVQGFYDRLANEHQAAAQELLDSGERDLAARLRGVMELWLDVSEPYHRFAVQFFKNAADPESPLSPFSPDSRHAREATIAIHEKVLSGSGVKVDAELAEMLPELLWMYQMGVVLFWVYDRSPGSERTRRLVARTAGLVARLVALSRYRIMRPVTREALDALGEFLTFGDRPAGSGSGSGQPPVTPSAKPASQS